MGIPFSLYKGRKKKKQKKTTNALEDFWGNIPSPLPPIKILSELKTKKAIS